MKTKKLNFQFDAHSKTNVFVFMARYHGGEWKVLYVEYDIQKAIADLRHFESSYNPCSCVEYKIVETELF